MKLQLIRHATSFIEYNGKRILLDPMLSPMGSVEAIPGVPNTRNNPTVELPDISQVLSKLDGVLVTHTHHDHYDAAAVRLMLSMQPSIFCQKEDYEKIIKDGFLNVHGIEESFCWEDINIFRTGGKHGTGEIGRRMGIVSGFVLKATGEPVVYITGDTIWCDEVEEAIEKHNPEIIICFAGGAQFSEGDPITMTKEDVYKLCLKAPKALIVAIHMEVWNHCRLSREELRKFTLEKGVNGRVKIPQDGEMVMITP